MPLKRRKNELRRKRLDARKRWERRTEQASAVDAIAFACARCSASIRLSLPAPAEAIRCPRCRHGYRVSTVSLDPTVVLLLSDSAPARTARKVAPSAFAVLELEPTQDLARVRLAYRRLVGQYHPDKVAGLGSELRRLAESKTRELIRAYESLEKSLSAPERSSGA